MAKQLITIGTPGAGGGDPAHVAFKKFNDNATELYDAAIPDTEEKKTQARANLSINKLVQTIEATQLHAPTSDTQLIVSDTGWGLWNTNPAFNPALPQVFGGTGASDAAGARANLSAIGIGEYGVGGTVQSFGNIGQATTQAQNPDIKTGMYEAVDLIGSFMAIKSPYGTFLFGGSAYNGASPQYVYYNSVNGNKILNAAAVHTFYTTQNAVKDGNGFLKGASPVADLYADKIELNREAQEQDITFEKIGTGDYLIKCSTGLASDGWYIEQPKDSNGNVYHAVEYGTHQNGDIWIKTYAKKLNDVGDVVADLDNPADIKEGRFISIRLNELPKDENVPAFNPELDNQGNAQPTRYHVLEEGVWTISDEHAALLEQERLLAMQPLKRRQFRLALVMNGFDLKAIETMIEQIEDPMQRTIAQIEWQDAGDFERTNPTLLMMAEMMELTPEQVDRLWSFGLAL